MTKYMLGSMILLAGSVSGVMADDYKVDPVHSSVIWRIGHAGVGVVYGQFKEINGQVTLDDADASKNSFTLTVPAASVDSRVEKRDAHLKSPDFLNVKQYPEITFKSTSVKKVDDKHLEVTGDFMLHGVTKSIVVPVELIGKGEFPKGVARVGTESVFTIKQSDFAIKGIPGGTSDEIRLMIALEATK